MTMTESNATEIRKILEEKALLFSDLHIGIRTDSEMWFNTAIKYSEWVKKTALEQNVNVLIFLGDFFHDREELRLTALNAADKFLENLKDFHIILLVGNHDCYYDSNTEINSLSIFNKWKNIIVVDKLEVVEYREKKFAFLPWGSDLNAVPQNLDYIFGHLEIESFRFNKAKICEHGIKSSELLKKAKTVFSGHFHIRSQKNYGQNSIRYIGNTFQQDWGDYGEEKGVELFNFETGETEFIKNTVSPEYVKVHLSKLLTKDKEELDIVKHKINNNFVKLILDQEVQPEKLALLSEKLTKLTPLQFNTETMIETEVKNADSFESVEIDMKLLLTEYINKLEISENKDNILQESLNLYNKALTQIKDDTNE